MPVSNFWDLSSCPAPSPSRGCGGSRRCRAARPAAQSVTNGTGSTVPPTHQNRPLGQALLRNQQHLSRSPAKLQPSPPCAKRSPGSPTRTANKWDAAEVLLCRCQLPPRPPAGAAVGAQAPCWAFFEVWLPRSTSSSPSPSPSRGAMSSSGDPAGACWRCRCGGSRCTHLLPSRTVNSSSSSRAPRRRLQRGAGPPHASMSGKALSRPRVFSGEAGE